MCKSQTSIAAQEIAVGISGGLLDKSDDMGLKGEAKVRNSRPQRGVRSREVFTWWINLPLSWRLRRDLWQAWWEVYYGVNGATPELQDKEFVELTGWTDSGLRFRRFSLSEALVMNSDLSRTRSSHRHQ